MVIIQLLWSLLSFASNYMFVKIGLESLFRLRTELYAHLQRLSLKFHDTRRSTDSSFRVAYDSQSIQTIYNKGFTNIIGSGVTLIGTFAVMLRLDWQLTLALAGHCAASDRHDLFLCQTDSHPINHHSGTGKRIAHADAGRIEFHSHGARIWPRRIRGLAIS